KGSLAPFIEMAALPESSRDVTNIYEREYKGGGAKFTNGDTLFARITPCLENGKTAKVTGLKCGDVGHGSTEFIVMSPRNPAADEDYVYYLARLPDFRAYAQARMEGTSGRQRVSWQSLAEFELQIPDAASRKRAGDILKTLDDKIQLNHQINQTLEQMAQAIFKSWFVDFEPVKAKIAALEAGGSEEDALRAAMQAISGKDGEELTRLQAEQPEQYAELRATAELFPSAMQDRELGEIPEGWEVQSVGDICRSTDYVANGSFKALKENVRLYDEKNEVIYVRTTDFNKGFASDLKYTDMASYEFLSKSKLFGRETIISNVGDVGTVFRAPTWLRQNMTLGSNAVALISGDYDGYLFWLFRSDHGQNLIQSIVTVSAQLKFNKTNHRALRVIMPSKSILDLFERKERIFPEKYNAIKRENLSLEHLRDYLLPKLLSGEASVIAVDHHPADEAETADV